MPNLLSPEQIKQKLGKAAADLISDGQVFGLGTGSTINELINELSSRVKQGLHISIIPTSRQTEEKAIAAGIRIADIDSIRRIPVTIDGADEIDPQGTLIKGGGGALLREKIVAAASDQLIILADHSKLSNQLGKFPLPVEVIPFGYSHVQRKIRELKGNPVVHLRMKESKIFLTDQQNWILDARFSKIEDAMELERQLQAITGIVETGLFIDLAKKAMIGYPDGSIQTIDYPGPHPALKY